ncbi:MAG: ABC transporter permease [Acidobacteriota bacterium]|nr:ABC transporter permease [Acidobacteriota bacterium]
MGHQLRLAFRSLRHQPAFALAALLTLALGIGATTALFTVVDGVLLRPVAVPEPNRLVHIWQHNFDLDLPRFTVSPPDYLDWVENTTSFSQLAAAQNGEFNLVGDGDPVRLLGQLVTERYFSTLGLDMVLGRSFSVDDVQPGATPVVVLGHTLWRGRFGGDRSILESTVRIDGQAYTVIGVAPEHPLLEREIWLPLSFESPEELRGAHFIRVFGRLAPGVSLEQAQQELERISDQLAIEYPNTNTGWGAGIEPIRELFVADARDALYTLLAAVLVVLLIACINVAHLLLVRLSARQREIAVRTALGASRRQVITQVLLECALLAVGGGILGVALALGATRALLALNPDAIPRASEVAVDSRVLIFAFALSLLTTLIFGLIPALRGSRPNLAPALKEGGRSQIGGSRWGRQSLVLVEVALAVVLIAGGGLLLRSFAELTAVSPGFNPQGVMLAELGPSPNDYPEMDDLRLFYERLYQRLGIGQEEPLLPGAEAVGTVSPLLMGRGMSVLVFSIEGRPLPGPNEAPLAVIHAVSPNALQLLEVPLQSGRALTLRDDSRAPRVVLINQTAAERYWPGEDPVGERLTFGAPDNPEAEWLTVVGVVGDTRTRSLGDPSNATFFLPELQQPMRQTTVLVRGPGGPEALANTLRDALAEVDPGLPVFNLRKMEAVVASAVAQPRFNTLVLGLFGGLALVLATIGVYGVTSYSVSQRRREIGIRGALGADRRGLLSWVLREGMKPVLLGAVVGVGVSVVAMPLLRGMIYGVELRDPWSFAAAVAVLVVAGLLACLLPARRAAGIDPAEALRYE